MSARQSGKRGRVLGNDIWYNNKHITVPPSPGIEATVAACWNRGNFSVLHQIFLVVSSRDRYKLDLVVVSGPTYQEAGYFSMRLSSLLLLGALCSLPLLSSCATTGTADFIKAGFEEEEPEGWASRYIPGVKTLSKLIPPPSEARIKWDEQQKRLHGRALDREGSPDL